MQPYISLKIRNFIPEIIFHPDEEMTRKMTLKEESISKNIAKAAKSLDIPVKNAKNDEEISLEIIELAKEADDTYLETYTEIDMDSIEFGLNELFEKMLKQGSNIENEYSDVEMEDKVRQELDANQNADIMASILDSMYLRLIAKTLIAASELGVGEIHLDDEHKNPRLAEKMGRELSKMDVTFIID